MPPHLALLLCTVFVAALLWIDHKRSPGQSKALWIPTLWMLYCASRSVSNWLGIGPVTDIDLNVEAGSPVDRCTLSILIFLGLVILQKRRFNWAQTIKDNRWLLVLFLYMLVSILWSDYPYVSFKRWVKIAGTVVMAMAVFSEPSPYEALRSVFIRTVYILIPFSAVLVKYFPHLGRNYGRWTGAEEWQGATLNRNMLGVLCVVSVLFIIWALLRRWQGKEPRTVRYQTLADVLVLGLTFWLMKGPGGSYSATSIAVLLVGLATFFMLQRLKASVRHLGTAVFLVPLGVGLVLLLMKMLGLSPVALATSALGRDETLTGRTDYIWAVLFPLAMKHPVLGVGYGAFWVSRPEGLDLDFAINEAHNGYLDVFIEQGVVGLILLLAVIVSFFKKAREDFEHEQDWASFRIAVLLIILLHNITESSLLQSTLLLWNLLVFLMVVHPNKQEVQELEVCVPHPKSVVEPMPAPDSAGA